MAYGLQKRATRSGKSQMHSLITYLKLTHALLVLATDCGIRVQLFLYLRNLRKPDSVPVNLFESLIISYI